MLALVFLLSLSAHAAPLSDPVHIVSEKISLTNLYQACHAARAIEPKYDFTYKVSRSGLEQTVTRPIYSDLCGYPTQQLISRIYSTLGSGDRTPIIGIMGSNEDQDDLGFAVLSRFVVR